MFSAQFDCVVRISDIAYIFAQRKCNKQTKQDGTQDAKPLSVSTQSNKKSQRYTNYCCRGDHRSSRFKFLIRICCDQLRPNLQLSLNKMETEEEYWERQLEEHYQTAECEVCHTHVILNVTGKYYPVGSGMWADWYHFTCKATLETQEERSS